MKPWHGFRRSRLSSSRGRHIRRYRRYSGVTMKDIFTFLSSLVLPVMLGVFTVVITYDQKDSASKHRFEDRRSADEEPDQDLNISREQRLEDRSFEQRREHELKIEDKRYRDVLPTSYMSEVSDLLVKNNGSLTNISLTGTLVRLKTLTLIHQLDSNGNSQVIRFLYEAGQLNARQKFLFNLSDAELSSIDMSSRKADKKAA